MIISRAVARRPVTVVGDPDRCLFQGPAIVEDELLLNGSLIGYRVRNVETRISFRADPAWLHDRAAIPNVISLEAARARRGLEHRL